MAPDSQPNPDRITTSPGTYVLVLTLGRSSRIKVGALGRRSFAAGVYLYVGSARGPGGLRARIAHHRRDPRSLHWHIDYLRRHARVTGVLLATGSKKRECDWARRLHGNDDLASAVAGFGASDCDCGTHLFFVAEAGGRLLERIGRHFHPVIVQSVCWSG